MKRRSVQAPAPSAILRWMRRALVAAAAALVFSLGAGPALGAEGRIQVLSVVSDSAFTEAQALTVALKRAASRAGWELDEGDYSLEVMAASFGCPEPPDDPCLKKIAGRIKSDHFMWGTLEKQGKELVATLRLWQGGKNARETTVRYPSNLTDPSDDALIAVAAKAVTNLSGSAPGTVVIVAGKLDGEVFVDGELVGKLAAGRAELELPAGKHEILVKTEGYRDAQGSVTVIAGMSVELPLDPAKPTAAGEGSAASDGGGAPDSSGGTNVRRIAAYSALGLGGAFAVGGVVSMLKVNSINNDKSFDDYRRGFSSNRDVCKEAEKGTPSPRAGAASASEAADFCSSASTATTLQFVFFGLAALAGGAGTYLLLTEPKQEAAARHVNVLAGVGPDGGEMRVRVAF